MSISWFAHVVKKSFTSAKDAVSALIRQVNADPKKMDFIGWWADMARDNGRMIYKGLEKAHGTKAS